MKRILTLISIVLLAIPSFSQVVRKTVVEHFTNSRCSVCASKNPALFSLLDNNPDVLHIAFHPSSPYSNCIFSQHNPAENDGRTNYYGIYGGTPRVVLQGNVIGFQTPLLTQEQLDGQLGMVADYSVSVIQTEQAGGQVNVTIEIEKLDGDPGELNLYAVIVEEFIDYTSPNGEDGHHNVFRKVLTHEPVSLPAVGSKTTVNKTYTLDPVWEESQMYVMAMVQSVQTSAIVQVERSDNLSGGPSFIAADPFEKIDNLFYPNPAKDILRINPVVKGSYTDLRIYNIHGRLLGHYPVKNELDISNLTPGQYIVVLTGIANERVFTRIVKY